MVGGGSVLNPQGPEPGEKREYGVPAQGERIVHENLCSGEPRADSPDRIAQEGKRRLRRIQASAPSAQRRGIGHAIGVFYGGRRGFPAAAFQEAALQRLAAGDEAVMAVGRRKGRQEGERLAAPVAKAAANPDPIMVLIVRLFAAAAMTDDGILSANRAMAQDVVESVRRDSAHNVIRPEAIRQVRGQALALRIGAALSAIGGNAR